MSNSQIFYIQTYKNKDQEYYIALSKLVKQILEKQTWEHNNLFQEYIPLNRVYKSFLSNKTIYEGFHVVYDLLKQGAAKKKMFIFREQGKNFLISNAKIDFILPPDEIMSRYKIEDDEVENLYLEAEPISSPLMFCD